MCRVRLELRLHLYPLLVQSPADMHANLDKLKNYVYNGKYLYSFTTYNKKSIMHYYFEPLAFVKGRNSKCYILQNNNVPSEEDKTFITQQYAPATFGASRIGYIA